MICLFQVVYNRGHVKRKQSTFEHAQNAQIQIILRMRKVSSGYLLSNGLNIPKGINIICIMLKTGNKKTHSEQHRVTQKTKNTRTSKHEAILNVCSRNKVSLPPDSIFSVIFSFLFKGMQSSTAHNDSISYFP